MDGEENLDRLGEDIVGMRSLNAKSRLHMPYGRVLSTLDMQEFALGRFREYLPPSFCFESIENFHDVINTDVFQSNDSHKPNSFGIIRIGKERRIY